MLKNKFTKATLWLFLSMVATILGIGAREYMLNHRIISQTQGDAMMWFGICFLIILYFRIMLMFIEDTK